MHRIAVLAAPPVNMFDLALPEEVFGQVRLDGRPGYTVVTCTSDPGLIETVTGHGIVVPLGLDAIDDADTVIVLGTASWADADPRILAALRAAARAGKRIMSPCLGAFLLARAGLLDGRKATTHWGHTAELSAHFPTVKLQRDVIYVADGPIFTTAGLAASIDLYLHLIRTDYGVAVANAAARLAVAAPVRPGGHVQVIDAPLPRDGVTSVAGTRSWALNRLDEPLTLAALARHARVSVRTLTRRFHEETGLSPLQWLLQQRVGRARELLESTDLLMDEVAGRAGLGTADSLRQHLVREVGLTPTAYRAAFSRLAPRGAVRPDA
ncbi:MAG TPA: helix-turn-helix domain-containing protein [Dactylosporangium sp.]|jgi:transcriptional regulator GlxA family with amidase domain|nr:helix-turn-helix domain-containing protein [Dactylosporangium sp.]